MCRNCQIIIVLIEVAIYFTLLESQFGYIWIYRIYILIIKPRDRNLENKILHKSDYISL